MNVNEARALLEHSGCSWEVIEHCEAVSDYAHKIALKISDNARNKRRPIQIDIDLVVIGALLHDIGRSRTHGIRHAITGAKIATDNGIDDKLVRIIERHIGAGILKEEAVKLGLPARNFVPESIEEKIVAYADNLVFGKKIGTTEELIENLRKKKLADTIIQRFVELNNEISAMMV